MELDRKYEYILLGNMFEQEEDNWLNSYILECGNCKEDLYICDHSPFESSVRMYCDSCCKRVDISMYDTNCDQYRDLEYTELLKVFETKLERCVCGGSFQLNAKRRCLHCNHTLELKEEQNVWLAAWQDDSDEELFDAVERKMKQFISNPVWKTDV
jgi:hypothetical protein